MRVRAKSAGFHDAARRRPGDVFDMDEKKFKVGKDGKPVVPSWVEPVKAEKPAEPKGEGKQGGDKGKGEGSDLV